MRLHVIAVDPGSEKCGIAVLTLEAKVVARQVVERRHAVSALQRLAELFAPAVLVMGDRTGSKAFLDELGGMAFEAKVQGIHTIDEHMSSLEARERYFKEHPPKGWKRFLPKSLQTPPVLYDDYVAVVLAERYISSVYG